jgi:hypothetical protein
MIKRQSMIQRRHPNFTKATPLLIITWSWINFQNTTKVSNARRYIEPSILLLFAAALFFVEEALGVDEPVTAWISVVVTTVTIALAVLADKVVPEMVEGTSVDEENDVTDSTLITTEPETCVEIVVGTRMVAGATIPDTVLGEMVVGGITLAGKVVVYVSVIGLPRLLIGTAEPTPVAVNWLGIGSVAVFGFAAGSFE